MRECVCVCTCVCVSRTGRAWWSMKAQGTFISHMCALHSKAGHTLGALIIDPLSPYSKIRNVYIGTNVWYWSSKDNTIVYTEVSCAIE